jgi:signal transduction histidine kinase
VNGHVGDESTLRIAIRVYRGAPRLIKVLTGLAILYIAAALAWMVAAMGGSALSWPPFWASIAGAGSAALLSWAYGLVQVAQGTWSTRWRLGGRPERMSQMLLALPVMAYTAGVLATVSAVASVPMAVRNGWFLLAVLPPVVVMVFAARAVSDATRFLYRHAQDRAEAAARAQAEAANARWAALQAQLNPHFLFNALNTIASLVRTNAGAAEATTENLAHILRRTLERSERVEVPLRDELEFVRAYLQIERERFGDRLVVEWAVPEETLDARVPPMTLQPLVENALRHGIGGRLEGGRVVIAAETDGTELRLTVRDDGIGFVHGYREGTGLGNLRRRLDTLYGARASLEVEAAASGAGLRVTIPLRGKE